jgi:hypothetical protein
VNGIASPDNVAVIEDFDTLLIGEDTSSHRVPLTPSKASVLESIPNSSQYSVLGRYRQRKVAGEAEETSSARSLAQMGIPEFLKRLARGNSAKL